MKITTQKANKRQMKIYAHSYKFRKPYQVIIDGTFIQVARMSGMKLEEALSRTLIGEIRPMTTYCCYAELKKLGPDFRPSAAMAKKLEKRRCPHTTAVSAAECIKQVMGIFIFIQEPQTSIITASLQMTSSCESICVKFPESRSCTSTSR